MADTPATNDFTYYVTLRSDGRTYQINGVEKVLIVPFLLSSGTRRDLPPPSPIKHLLQAGAAGVYAETDDAVVKRDDWTGTPPYLKHEPYALLWFKTNRSNAPDAPTGELMADPTTNFRVIECDCFFPFLDVSACGNTPPEGYTPADSR